MPNDQDLEERKLTTRMFVTIAAAIVIIGAVLFLFVVPVISEAVAPGLGLRTSAAIAFVVTLVVMVVLMIAAGDGLLGEIQFTLLAFFVFFIIVWLIIAWVF